MAIISTADNNDTLPHTLKLFIADIMPLPNLIFIFSPIYILLINCPTNSIVTILHKTESQFTNMVSPIYFPLSFAKVY